MPARRDFPLVLLLLAWTVPTRIHCQNATASLVSTEYVEVTWTKQLLWYGIDEFQVNVTSPGSYDCFKIIPCPTVTCTFNSVLCGLLPPCTPASITISGGDHTAPTLSLVTGPEKVTDMSVSLKEGVEYISWVNPSMDSSPCYENTAVRISFNDEDFISYFSLEEEKTNKSLCVIGYGEVEVWTQGGDGHSNSSWGTIAYNGSSVVDLVTFKTCEPVGCSGIKVEWFYVPVCPDVAYLQVNMDDVGQNVSTSATNLTVMGLGVQEEYSTCVRALSKVGKLLDSSCRYYCRTAYEVPENLVVEPLSSSSLRVTWDPPVCQKNPQISYVVRLHYTDYTTTATKYDVGGLSEFTEYEVEVYVDQGYYYDENVISTDAFTLLPSPSSLYIDSVHQDYVDIHWYFYVSSTSGYDIYYKVTWGTSQQYEDKTKEKRFTIRGFNSTDEVFKVCVAAVPQGREDLTSYTVCEYVLASDSGNSEVLRTWGIVIAVLLVIVVMVVIIIITFNVFKKSKAQRLQQQQQQQQLQYNYGIDNPGANR